MSKKCYICYLFYSYKLLRPVGSYELQVSSLFTANCLLTYLLPLLLFNHIWLTDAKTTR